MFPIMMLALSLIVKAPDPSVILITIDGVMWQDIYGDQGRQLVPYLYSDFVEQGIAIGKLSSIIASGPFHVSIPGYLEITRGHPSPDCQRNDCYPVIDRSILQLYDHTAVFSSWSPIEKTIPANHNIYRDTGFGYRYDVETESA